MNDPRIPADGEDDGYSATALGSQWFERPHTDSAPEASAPAWGGQPMAAAVPDRVEGEILRFGPGVTAAVQRNHAHTAVDLWHGTLPGPGAGGTPTREPRRGGLRRYALAALVLLAVLVFLAWQRFGPALAVDAVTVRTDAAGPECDGTADVVGVVRTNGRAGTLTYRWVRSDGTESGLLREKLTRGQQQARLHLLWTFHGRGAYRADAELHIVEPSRHTAAAQFRYRCD